MKPIYLMCLALVQLMALSANADTCGFNKGVNYKSQKLVLVFASPAQTNPLWAKHWYVVQEPTGSGCEELIKVLKNVEQTGWCTPNWNAVGSYILSAEGGPGYFTAGGDLDACRVEAAKETSAHAVAQIPPRIPHKPVTCSTPSRILEKRQQLITTMGADAVALMNDQAVLKMLQGSSRAAASGFEQELGTPTE